MAMKDSKILMLAWDDAAGQPGPSESWLPVAADLAAREPVQVVLPRAHPGLLHKNITITETLGTRRELLSR